MRFKAHVESIGDKSYIGYIDILSRGHQKFKATVLDADSFAIDISELGCTKGVEVFNPKRSFKKYRAQLAQVLEELEEETPAQVKRELEEGIEKALDWMEQAIKDKQIVEFERLTYCYGS